MTRPKLDCIIVIMSGHSKWSTIKRKKGANDAARGKLFSKLAKAISIAVKTGGGDNPDTNYSLRVAIEAAKAENMPKDTIQRAINKAQETGDLKEVSYEGFLFDGIQVIIEAATDNRNRTAQIVKSLLDKAGGSMSSPGSVSFNFEKKGLIIVKKSKDVDTQTLEIIDLGAEDIQETKQNLEVYVDAASLFEIKNKLENSGYEVRSSELIQRPKQMVKLEEQKKIDRLSKIFAQFDDEEDVQKVFTNADFDE